MKILKVALLMSKIDADHKVTILKVHFWDAGQLDDDSLAGGVFTIHSSPHQHCAIAIIILIIITTTINFILII